MPNETRCQTLFDAGQIAAYMGRYADAQVHLEEALRIARALQSRARIAAVLQPLALASIGQGDAAGALAYLEEGLAIARDVGDRRQIAGSLNALAQVHRVEGDLEQAAHLYDQMLKVTRELGDKDMLGVGLLNIAMVAIATGHAERSSSTLLEVVAIARETGSKPTGQGGLDVCAGLAASWHEHSQAAVFFGAAEALAEQTGMQRDPTDSAFLMPLIETSRVALGEAPFTKASNAGRSLNYEQSLAQARDWLQSRA
jgi:tetratricopeptide (TPR) repeat protein